jgi:hypothetical protein
MGGTLCMCGIFYTPPPPLLYAAMPACTNVVEGIFFSLLNTIRFRNKLLFGFPSRILSRSYPRNEMLKIFNCRCVVTSDESIWFRDSFILFVYDQVYPRVAWVALVQTYATLVIFKAFAVFSASVCVVLFFSMPKRIFKFVFENVSSSMKSSWFHGHYYGCGRFVDRRGSLCLTE